MDSLKNMIKLGRMTQAPLLSLICALSRNYVIGIKNDLPWHLPQDLEHFKNLTKGKPIIMGRKTYESILARRSGKPLPHRPHYVVTTQRLENLPQSVKTAPDLLTAIEASRQDYPQSEIMVIGGASLYEQALPWVDRMYLTIIEQEIEGDAYFPRWNDRDWQITESQGFTEPYPFSFLTFDRCR